MLVGTVAEAQVTQRVSLDAAGVQANAAPLGRPWISGDGRFVVFGSGASNLVPGDTNGVEDIFVRDRLTGTIERVSVDSAGAQGNARSRYPFISRDGRYVVFQSDAGNLDAGDANNGVDVFLRDRQSNTTERVSVASNGGEGGAGSMGGSITPDGRYVVFSSLATALVPGDTNNREDIFVRDRQNGTTERRSVTPIFGQGNNNSYSPAISDDGVFATFATRADNLTSGDPNGSKPDVLIGYPNPYGCTPISVDSQGNWGNDTSEVSCIAGSVSSTFYAAYDSLATNLVAGDTNATWDIFAFDILLETTTRISVDSNGAQANGASRFPTISADCRYVAFQSDASNLVPGDTNGVSDVFVRDLVAGTTRRVSVGPGGVESNGASTYPVISGDGRYVAFDSVATNLVIGDTNGIEDVFVHDLLGGTNFTSLCHPGLAGVQPCPCSNPPSGAGRGCNNSASTGGAILSASGGTFLTSDSLVFATSGEKPTATSVVLQGTTLAATGIVYGQGLRCLGGNLNRLYTKSAVAGSITAPNFGAGDATVSSRSASKGDVIQPGQSRWYLVFYRDPVVLGGCAASKTFNATQTGVVAWSP